MSQIRATPIGSSIIVRILRGRERRSRKVDFLCSRCTGRYVYGWLVRVHSPLMLCRDVIATETRSRRIGWLRSTNHHNRSECFDISLSFISPQKKENKTLLKYSARLEIYNMNIRNMNFRKIDRTNRRK